MYVSFRGEFFKLNKPIIIHKLALHTFSCPYEFLLQLGKLYSMFLKSFLDSFQSQFSYTRKWTWLFYIPLWDMSLLVQCFCYTFPFILKSRANTHENASNIGSTIQIPVIIIIIRLCFVLSPLLFLLKLVAAKSLWKEDLCLAGFVPSRWTIVTGHLPSSYNQHWRPSTSSEFIKYFHLSTLFHLHKNP